jgi:hypothetical protein
VIFDDELLRAVEVGQAVYHRLPVDDQPGVVRRGGIVVAIDTDVDGETGEIGRAFITATTPGGTRVKFDRLAAGDVDLARSGPRNTSHVASLSRRIALVYGGHRGPITSEDYRLVETAYQLARAVG